MILPVIFYYLFLNNGYKIETFEVFVHDGILKYVVPLDRNDYDLNLSNYHLRDIVEGAFNEVYYIKSLDLSQNEFMYLPMYVFSNLTDLEYLCLAKNNFQSVFSLFVGLNRLKVLDLSENHYLKFDDYPLTELRDETEIRVYHNELLAEVKPVMFNKNSNMQVMWPTKTYSDEFGNHTCFSPHKNVKKVLSDSEELPVIICMIDGIVQSVEVRKERYSDSCLSLGLVSRTLFLEKLDIRGFERDWYRLPRNLQVKRLNLNENGLTELSDNIFNNLPTSIDTVSINKNKIRRINSNAIINNSIRHLYICCNEIEIVEVGAFKELVLLETLEMSFNLLSDVYFASSLSSSLQNLHLQNNKITSIPERIFSHLNNLYWLDLSDNKVSHVERATFNGLRNLHELSLGYNRLTRLERNVFDELSCIEWLDLDANNINFIEKGFAGKMNNLEMLNVIGNRIDKFEMGLFYGMPSTSTVFGATQVKSLQPGMFKSY